MAAKGFDMTNCYSVRGFPFTPAAIAKAFCRLSPSHYYAPVMRGEASEDFLLGAWLYLEKRL